MSRPIPVTTQPFLYINDLNVARESNTTLSISAGRCRDASNTIDMVLSDGVIIDTAVVGANGIDTGTLAASDTYYVFLIGNSYKPAENFDPAGLISASATPLLPEGYDSYRLIQYWFTDGSSHFYGGYVSGNQNYRKFKYDASVATSLTAGQATSLTGVSLANIVPPVDKTPVLLDVSFTPASAANTVGFTPYGSSATNLVTLSGVVASQAQRAPIEVLTRLNSSAPTFLYINSAASCTTAARVLGFEFYV